MQSPQHPQSRVPRCGRKWPGLEPMHWYWKSEWQYLLVSALCRVRKSILHESVVSVGCVSPSRSGHVSLLCSWCFLEHSPKPIRRRQVLGVNVFTYAPVLCLLVTWWKEC